ncbi:hypothetical protein TSUD_142850 [Trifolium subterraneum]|uniref:DUF4283 domain-containing protein n=1 Tax=Trifolium subterraneum TaxID=3900 RepID=A0A2Z6NE33_TRISU|nr:hypothetical protein TSUD_142850 [Trifolium subterraneum]
MTSDSNPLLGFTSEHHTPSRDEIDQMERSSKKMKGGGGRAGDDTSMEVVGSMIVSKSYKETVVGVVDYVEEEEARRGKVRGEEAMAEEDENTVEGKVEEQRIGDIECPKFSFSLKEEQRIQRPWKQGVIVQLLGRKIGYKALENRLQQLWESTLAKNSEGVIMIDEGLSMQSLPHNDKREKIPQKSNNERFKGQTNSSKGKKTNATRVNFKEKTGPTNGKKNDTLADLMATNAFDTFVETHCNPMKKNVMLTDNKSMGQCSNALGQVTGPKSMIQDQVEGAHEIVSTNLNYHREPGLKESKNFHGPVQEHRRPALENTFSLQPNNTGGGSLELEVFEDANENGDSSAEECDMNIAGEGVNQNHAEGEIKGNL